MKLFGKRHLGILVLFLLLGWAAGLYQNSIGIYQKVVVKLPSGIDASLYKDRGGDGAFNYDSTKPPLYSITGTTELSLKRGNYDIVLKNPSDFANSVKRVTVDYGTKEIAHSPSYTSAKLSSLLPSTRAAALKSLYDSYPRLDQNYTVINDRLYGIGEWYGVVFQPKDQVSYDTVRMLARKDGEAWRPAIDQPIISIGQPSNPDIPLDILRDVNSL